MCGNKASLLERVDQSTLRWFGRLERMDEGRLTKRIYRGEGGGFGKLEEQRGFSFGSARLPRRDNRKIIIWCRGRRGEGAKCVPLN